jgi:hypothetical protein
MRRYAQSGQAMAEFLLVAGALAVALFYPFIDGESVSTLLLRSLMQCMRARTFLLSIL